MSLRQGVDITWKQWLFPEFSGAFFKTACFCPLLRCTICKLRAHFDIPTLLRLVRKRFVLGRPFAALRGSLDRLSAFIFLVGHGISPAQSIRRLKRVGGLVITRRQGQAFPWAVHETCF